MSDLAVRTVSCKGWRWLPGMLAIPGNGLMSRTIRLTEDQDWPHDLGLRLPDLSDPATGGLILQLLAELPLHLEYIGIEGTYRQSFEAGEGHDHLFLKRPRSLWPKVRGVGGVGGREGVFSRNLGRAGGITPRQAD